MKICRIPEGTLERCRVSWWLADAAREVAEATSAGLAKEAAMKACKLYTDLALAETSRLTLSRHQVGQGRQLVAVDSKGSSWRFEVDFVRPTTLRGVDCFAVSGVQDNGRRALLFLGYDELTVLPGAGVETQLLR